MKIEIDKPVIPKFVADYLCRAKVDITLMRVLEIASTRDELLKWEKEYDWISANDETFARAWLDGYEIEQEPRYYAKSKLTGQYLGNKDIGVGYGVSKPYWVSNKLCFQVEKLPKEVFKKVYGLDDTNTYFERVEQ